MNGFERCVALIFSKIGTRSLLFKFSWTISNLCILYKKKALQYLTKFLRSPILTELWLQLRRMRSAVMTVRKLLCGCISYCRWFAHYKQRNRHASNSFKNAFKYIYRMRQAHQKEGLRIKKTWRNIFLSFFLIYGNKIVNKIKHMHSKHNLR